MAGKNTEKNERSVVLRRLGLALLLTFLSTTLLLAGCGKLWISLSSVNGEAKSFKDFAYAPSTGPTNPIFGFLIDGTGHFSPVPGSGTNLLGGELFTVAPASLFSQIQNSYFILSGMGTPSPIRSLSMFRAPRARWV